MLTTISCMLIGTFAGMTAANKLWNLFCEGIWKNVEEDTMYDKYIREVEQEIDELCEELNEAKTTEENNGEEE